jgi:small subunit ribosomal protein S9
MFNLKTALFASVLYAFSPYAIIASRMPYHTNPIILLTLLFIFSMHTWIKGSMLYFPLTLLCITLLYNFELQTVILVPIVLLFLLYGFIKKTIWFKNLFTKKIIVLSLLSLIVPMLPVILYDLQHGFPQTIVFAGWIFYKIFKSIQGGESLLNVTSLISYFEDFISKLYFVSIREMSAMFFILSFIYLFITNVWGFIAKSLKLNYLLLFIVLIFTLLGIFVNKTPSDAIKKTTEKYVYAVGRRKTASVQARLFLDSKEVPETIVNGRALKAYFGTASLVANVLAPIKAVGMEERATVSLLAQGGGLSGQSDASKLAIARALVKHDALLRPALKAAGFLTRDARKVERKKPGLKKARKSPQWAKR